MGSDILLTPRPGGGSIFRFSLDLGETTASRPAATTLAGRRSLMIIQSWVLAERVLKPLAGWFQGDRGWLLPLDLPRPPPCGWSTAFMAVPRPLRDWVYDFVASHRYRWFGRRDVCMVPTPELRSRFLND